MSETPQPGTPPPAPGPSSSSTGDRPSPEGARPGRRRRLAVAAVVLAGLLAGSIYAFTSYQSYSSVYDAAYVGSAACADCHRQVYEEWANSPHALMVRRPGPESVVGDFSGLEWSIPLAEGVPPPDGGPVARMGRDGDGYVMSLRKPGTDAFEHFTIDWVVGFQMRQTYLHEESGGVLRRLPIQWSVERQEYFPYWNLQEGSPITNEDLWAQMRSVNSAWNLFCARCHVTKLTVHDKDDAHTRAHVEWVDEGIACESCHGPGSHHVDYFEGNYVNRLAAFVNGRIRGEPVAYVANAPKLAAGPSLSVCARCHGPDIAMVSTDAYRRYEPGYSGEGRLNDLSPHFTEYPLQPDRQAPTVECWADGRPKGIGMLFRSFVESACVDHSSPDTTGPRCYDCHDPHANQRPTSPGLLEPSAASNAYCLKCHDHLRDRIEEHSMHRAGTPGSFCYDCHMPHDIQSIVSGVEHFVRTHTMSSIPDPLTSLEHGVDRAPNACNECHADETPGWAARWMHAWWPDR